MLIIFPFSVVDQELALKNARWIAELGEYKSHDIFILSDQRCDPEINRQVVETFSPVFRLTKHRLTKVDIDGWPQGANYMLELAATLIQNTREWPYFFWLEPDAIPLRAGWLDAIVEEHTRSGKHFLGDRVEVGDIPLHMSGVGIYPNPLVLHAGEACRAHDIAWDIAAKDQIIPKAHFTNLIEHAWRHPTFKDQSEVNTQIAKETVLFHSSKDGSLIDRLREKAASVHNTNSVATEPTSGMSSREEIGTRPAQPSPELVYDIFIRTYPGDYEWLYWCIRSIDKFVTGFRRIWIVSPKDKPEWMTPRMHKELHSGTPIEWKVMNDETEDGYLAQQITKLYADVITDYQADYILHVDSDIVFTRPATPGDFFTLPLGSLDLREQKMIWYYTPHDQIQTPWQPIMEKFMGFHQPYEFMRRLPMMVPRWLYPKLREFCHMRHGMVISDYIRMQPQRAFSEFNALGAYAYFNHPDSFAWINTTTAPMPGPAARQFFSWGGITTEVKTEIDTILGGGVTSSPAPHVQPEESPPSQIKKLPNDIWVLHGDQISEWVEQEGRLDHDQNLLPGILKHIKNGDTVVDAGAFIGDHTIAYSNAVGKHGLVLAYEPNPIAFQCLKHNVENMPTWYNVIYHNNALGDEPGRIPLSGNNGNAGGCYIGDHMKVADVPMLPLDRHLGETHVNFIKIDVEGYELKVLKGAEKTISRCRPKMVIEINSAALARQSTNPGAVLTWLENHDYTYSIMQENCGFTDPLFDILCLPSAKPPETFNNAPAHSDQPASVAPVAPIVGTFDDMKEWVDHLKRYSDASAHNKMLVRQRLVYVGINPISTEKEKEKA